MLIRRFKKELVFHCQTLNDIFNYDNIIIDAAKSHIFFDSHLCNNAYLLTPYIVSVMIPKLNIKKI